MCSTKVTTGWVVFWFPPNHGNGEQHWRDNLPIFWEASHVFHNKYEGPSFYLGDPLFTQNKAHSIS